MSISCIAVYADSAHFHDSSQNSAIVLSELHQGTKTKAQHRMERVVKCMSIMDAGTHPDTGTIASHGANIKTKL